MLIFGFMILFQVTSKEGLHAQEHLQKTIGKENNMFNMSPLKCFHFLNALLLLDSKCLFLLSFFLCVAGCVMKTTTSHIPGGQ